MKPGQTVASPRSITVVPSGVVGPTPTAVMVLPSTITVAFAINLSDLPSNSRAALSTIGLGGIAGWAPAAERRMSEIRLVEVITRVAPVEENWKLLLNSVAR